jgi:hypothetical protein
MSYFLQLFIIYMLNVIGQHFRIGCWMIAASLLGVLLACSVSSQEKISIGSFEGSLDGWTVATPATGTLTTTYSNIQGSKVLTAQEGASFGLAKSFDIRTRLEHLGAFIIRRSLIVEAGDVLSGWSFFRSSTNLFFLQSHGSRAMLSITDGSGKLVTVLVGYESGMSVLWERFEYLFSNSGNFTLELEINSSGFSLGSDYVGLDGFIITSPDRKYPVVSAPGAISISLNPGEAELAPSDDRLSAFLAGATAFDEVDGDITATAVNLPQSFAVGETEIRFEATDKSGNTGFATSKVIVVKGNIPPIAMDDSAKAKSGQTVSIVVTDNDSDADGDSLTVTIAQPPKHGTVNVNADGTAAYTAKSDFVGSDSFTYTISDGRGGTAVATVTITVKSPLGPVVAAPPEIIITVDAGVEQVAASDERIAAFLNGATALDETNGVVPVTAVDAPATFLLGETTVRFQAVDMDGNIGFAYSKVTVKSTPAICKPLPSPDEINHQPVPGEYAFKIYAEQFLAAEILTREQLVKLHPKPLRLQIIGEPRWTTWYADEKEYERLSADPFDPVGIHSDQRAVSVLDNPLKPMIGDTPSILQEIRFGMTWHHSSDDFVIQAHHLEFALKIVFISNVTFRVHTLEEGAQGHIVQLLDRDPALKFLPPADRQRYQKSDMFDDVFDEAYYAPSFFNEGFTNLSSPFRFLGRKCRSIVEVKLDLDVRGPGLHYRGRLGEGLTAEQEKEFVEPRVGELNALGIELVRFIADRAVRLNAGYFIERYIRPVAKPPENTIPPPPLRPKPERLVSPPIFTPPPLLGKQGTPTAIMGNLEKNFHKLSPEEQEELINKLKYLPVDEKEQLSPFFRDILKKGK